MESQSVPQNSNRQSNNSDNESDSSLLPASSRGTLPETSIWGKRLTVAILFFINLINYMDRFTLAGILTEIQDFFEIGDDKGGLIQTVFVVSYMIFAPLFGYLGDRFSRTRIMCIGILLWSMTTLVGSFMNSFGWFIFFRALVGIGEASYSTIAPTVISDMFVKDSRSTMLAIFYFAIPVGSGLGYIVGAETAKAMGSWHWGLRVTPVLGIVAAILLMIFVNDPQRGEAEGGSNIRPSSYKEDIRVLLRNRSFMLSTAAFTCVAFVAGALAWWGPHYIYLGIKLQARNEPISFSSVSLTYGAISMMSGLIGVSLGSGLGNLLQKKYSRIHPIICGVGMIVSAPFLVAVMVLIEDYYTLPFVLTFFAQVSLNLNWAIVTDMCMYVVIPTRRSTAEAFQILVSHTFGDAGSPYIIGLVSEALKSHLTAPSVTVRRSISDNTTVLVQPQNYDDDWVKFRSLQYALFITCFVEILGGILFLITAKYIVKDKESVQKEIEDGAASPPIFIDAARPT